MDADAAKQCVPEFTGNCNEWGMYPPLRMSCDGQEDCAAEGELCMLYEGSLGTYTGCWPFDGGPPDDCSQNCSCGFDIVCRTLADCPACARSCEPYNGPGYPVAVCHG
jgi:hypothetical protein